MKTDAVFAGAAEVKEESVDEFPDGGYARMFRVLLHNKKITFLEYLCYALKPQTINK